MRSLVLWVAGVVTACGDDPMLHVGVDHPDKAPIHHTIVSVYESPALTCDDIAFSRIGSVELDSARVAEQRVAADGAVEGSLAGLSRTDRKLVVARGYDASDTWITAGCEQVDLVDGDVTVVIDTKATVEAAIIAEPMGLPMSEPYLVRFSTLDARGEAAVGRRTSWTVYGPAGSAPASTANATVISDGVWEPNHASCTGGEGAIGLHPPPPSTIGGYAVQLRAEWAVQLPSLYTGFVANFAPTLLTPPAAASNKLCAVRKSGTTRRLVCIDGTVARDLELVVVAGRSMLVLRDTQTIGADALAVISVQRGSDRDAYLVTATGGYVALFGAPAPVSSTPCSGCTVTDAIAVPPCGLERARILLRLDQTNATQVKSMNSDGSGLADFASSAGDGDTVQLDNAGCVTRLDPDGAADFQRQVITYHVGEVVAGDFVPTTTRAHYTCMGTPCGNDLPVPGAGSGFHTIGEPRMIATLVDASGVVLSHLVMANFVATRDRFIERDRYPAAGQPDIVVTGQFDADGEPDVFWSMDAVRGTTFEVAYSRRVGSQPLEALSALQLVKVGSLLAGDLDGDALDEVIMVGQIKTMTGAEVTGAIVVPMQKPAEPQTISVDPACAP